MYTQSLGLTLCGPLDSSPPGSSVHENFQARILEWIAISSFIALVVGGTDLNEGLSPCSSDFKNLVYLRAEKEKHAAPVGVFSRGTEALGGGHSH